MAVHRPFTYTPIVNYIRVDGKVLMAAEFKALPLKAHFEFFPGLDQASLRFHIRMSWFRMIYTFHTGVPEYFRIAESLRPPNARHDTLQGQKYMRKTNMTEEQYYETLKAWANIDQYAGVSQCYYGF